MSITTVKSINLKSLSPAHKQAVFKLAVELVKADNKIHSKEISVLDELQQELSMSQEELDRIHYLTLHEAISALKLMNDNDIDQVLNLFNRIMKVDNDIDFEENLLLSSIVMSCENGTRDWASVISAAEVETAISGREIIYLEKIFCPKAHEVLDDKYDNLLISKAFGDIGFDFFYLPNILWGLGQAVTDDEPKANRFSLLQKSMEYLMPAGDKVKVNNIEKTLESYDISRFFKIVTTRLCQDPGFFPYDSFILIKIRDSFFLDDDDSMKPVIDFLAIDISQDVKKRILDFVSRFDEKTNLLPYEGYYRLLYDDLSSESKTQSSIAFDASLNFLLADLGNEKITFESSPQARTFYLLLLHAGQEGLPQSTIKEAIEYIENTNTEDFLSDGIFDLQEFKQHLRQENNRSTELIYNTITIYQSVSTKDELRPNYLRYIISILAHRSSLKTYLNKGFSSIAKLADPQQYFVLYDKQTDTYFVSISESQFCFISENGTLQPIKESPVWRKLI